MISEEPLNLSEACRAYCHMGILPPAPISSESPDWERTDKKRGHASSGYRTLYKVTNVLANPNHEFIIQHISAFSSSKS